MQNGLSRWQIHIDTGGTFTDCIAKDPQGNIRRVKVLSSSALRGKILESLSPTRLRIATQWDIKTDIFSGYTFTLLGNYSKETTQVDSIDLTSGILHLASPISEVEPHTDFEIYGGEEAPVLAARLATATPLHQPLPPLEMRLGSTKGTNALLERKGARTLFITTKGFEDLLEIGNQTRPDLFALNIQKSRPLCEQSIGTAARLDKAGEIISPLTDQEIRDVVQHVISSECEAVALAFMHAYLNPVHEQRVAAALREAGIHYVSASHAIASSIKLLPRAQTTVVNAYLSPIIESYLNGVNRSIPEGSLKVMTSAGGLVDHRFFMPKDSLLSGPAGGIVGAARAARLSGIRKILTLDMGGTSTDVARYAGSYEYQYESKVGDAHLLSPSMAIETVAAGGGSICHFDGHKLVVGPESAGAVPGPACYGAGGPLTLTDVNLLLGRIDPTTFGIPLNIHAAREALDKIQIETQVPARDILSGFLQIANERMAEAIRTISVRKGYDPVEHALLAFGGAGGQHACQVAQLLGMTQIIIPYDAGILSAVGMEHAIIERMVTRQVLQPYTSNSKVLEQAIAAASQAAREAVEKETDEPARVHIRSITLHMRFQGQENSLEIAYDPHEDHLVRFRNAYEKLYGYWVTGQTIEVESVKVIAALQHDTHLQTLDVKTDYAPIAEGKNEGFSIYRWESLAPGAEISGPALLVSRYSTTVVEPGWTLKLDSFNHALLTFGGSESAGNSPSAVTHEAIALELFTNRFRAIADEMGVLLERTSFSVNVKERMDFSCALLDPDGELLVNAPHIPVHLGSLGVCVRSVRKAIKMEPGDIIITNHPGFGGSHLPDITLISPVFLDSGELAGYVANRAHHAELGGTRPGSMPPDASSLGEEGVVIAPTWLVRKGEIQWTAITDLLTADPWPTRALNENIADLNAGIASIRAGSRALIQLCTAHGLQTVHTYMRMLKAYAHTCLTKGLSKLTQTTYQARETLDDGSPIQVAIKVEQDNVHIDFSGTAPVHPGNLNANPAIVNSAVIYVLRLLVDENIPLNEGLMEAVTLNLPEGLLNPVFPSDPMQCPAVVGGNVETSQRLVDTLLKALELAACSQGTMNNLLFGNDRFGYYETIGGGTGAGPGFAGAHAVHQHMTNTRITDPEVLEFRYPVRLDRFAIRKKSGGDGTWSGGDGIIRQLTFLEAVSLTILSQHREIPPFGLNGGESGATGRQFVIRKDGKPQPISGIEGVYMQSGDSIFIETPGGGGFGKRNN